MESNEGIHVVRAFELDIWDCLFACWTRVGQSEYPDLMLVSVQWYGKMSLNRGCRSVNAKKYSAGEVGRIHLD